MRQFSVLAIMLLALFLCSCEDTSVMIEGEFAKVSFRAGSTWNDAATIIHFVDGRVYACTFDPSHVDLRDYRIGTKIRIIRRPSGDRYVHEIVKIN